MTEHTGRAGDGARRVILLIGMTLDGFNAGGWTPRAARPEDKTEMFDEVWRQLDNVDTFLMGRVTFELWQEHWPALGTAPSSSAFEQTFSSYIDGIQKVVYSRTLGSVSWRNARLVPGSIAEDVARMKQTPGGDVVIAGGARLAAAFGAADLIDEYRLWLHPEIADTATPCFLHSNSARSSSSSTPRRSAPAPSACACRRVRLRTGADPPTEVVIQPAVMRHDERVRCACVHAQTAAGDRVRNTPTR